MLRRDLLRLRNAAGPLVEVCNRLEHTELMPIDREMQPHFRDVTDHVRRVSEEIDALREVLAFAFEASLMAGQAQQTVIARRVAAWAAILAVPTAIAGIYGMNFDHMPELKWAYGYFLASKCSVCVPEAISELRIAEQHIRDGKPDEALKWIAAALIHLDQLSRAFVEASKERAAEEGGHLVGEED